MSTRLSKSRFQKGLQCEKALWLSVHEPASADPVPESRQWVFDRGTEVGRIAHGLFPGGVEIEEDYLHSTEALAATSQLLARGSRVLYEPAFQHDGILVRVDILVQVPADGNGRAGRDETTLRYDLYEVKSTSRLKPEHVTDAAVQTYVVEGTGLRVRKSCIVHLDTSYVYEGGPYDPARLFAIEDVTEDVRSFIPKVPYTAEAFRRMLDGPEPEVLIGARCRNPYTCDFATRCHAFLPAVHPITELPRLSDALLHQLLSDGILNVADIPEGYPGPSWAQRSLVNAVRAGVPDVDVAGLRRDLSSLVYPIRHLDFETFRSALPLWPGNRPYELIPFQYSIHVEGGETPLEERSYLHDENSDPRPALTERLLDDVGDLGSVIHYTSYEKQVLDALAIALPHLAASIGRVKERMIDLEAIVRSRTCHPAANGRTSIKAVLPAWCADVSYDGLGIGDGETASVRYLQAITGALEDDARAEVLADLRTYCGTDTLAMVKLLGALRDYVSAAG